MTATWTAEQVLALAPDASSAKAGKELAGPRKWVSRGAAEGVIWGECQGSGASPYQTKIDLSEPAFSCSCPSRKFPCKHGLGLLLGWADNAAAFAVGAPPPWVESWLQKRAEQAGKKAEKEQQKQEKMERGEPTADLAAQAKREAARRAKVAAGLDELGLWINDLVRQGLAALQGRPGSIWDERARRLIDAQAPGAARRVRQVAALSFAGEGWQSNLLDRLARLHLLVEAGRRLDQLPEGEQADARAVIGFPVDLDAVRSGPGVRDAWRVVGQRVEADERLRTQRTWLVGRDTGRPALVLDFAAGPQPLDATLPAGSMLEADLAFAPGAVPLRALVKERHAPIAPIDALGGFASIADAHAAYAATLARSPWIELFPMGLENVALQVDGGSWSARDAAGALMPLSPRFGRGWHLLAISGGGPVSLFGEYDGEVLEPLSAWVGGRFRTVAPADAQPRAGGMPSLDAPPALAELWREVAASALVGTDRRPPPPLKGDDPLAVALRGVESAGPPARLLSIAAAASLYGRAGRRSAIDPGPVPTACEPDPVPECHPACTARLQRLLGGEHHELLPEWLDALAASGRRLPAELLPELLAVGRGQSIQRPRLRSTLGALGRWLSRRNPEWSWVGGDAETADPEATWQTGTKAERLVALGALRKSDPARALALLASTWAREAADDRAAFLETLDVNLSPADEPFLDAALDDRSKGVRRAAAERLAALTGSAFAHRMAEWAGRYVKWSGKALVVGLPKEYDKEMARLQIEEKPRGSLGARSYWLMELVALAPLWAWRFNDAVTPAGLATSLEGHDARVPLWVGWSRAAGRERDEGWAVALLGRPTEQNEFRLDALRALMAALTPARRDALLLDRLRAEPGPIDPIGTTAHLLQIADDPIGPELAAAVLDGLRQFVAGSTRRQHYATHWGATSLIEKLGRLAPVALLAEAERGWPAEGPPRDLYGAAVDSMLDALRFRHEMHEEFAR